MKMTLSKRFPFAAALALAMAFAAPAPAQSPPDAELQFSTGVMHLREGRADMALQAFKKAVRADSKNPYFQKGLGQAYAAKRDFAAAIEAFRKALELNPYYVDVRNDLGYALIMSGDRAGGKKEFLTAFADPMNPAPEISAFNLGRAYLEENNRAEATNWFRTSLTRNKSYPAPYLLLAETLASEERIPEAITQLEAGIRDAPSEPELLLALGRAYQKVGRLVDARVKLEEAVKADPSGPVGKMAGEQLKALGR